MGLELSDITGDYVKSIRQHLKMGRDPFAQHIGIKSSAVWRIETKNNFNSGEKEHLLEVFTAMVLADQVKPPQAQTMQIPQTEIIVDTPEVPPAVFLPPEIPIPDVTIPSTEFTMPTLTQEQALALVNQETRDVLQKPIESLLSDLYKRVHDKPLDKPIVGRATEGYRSGTTLTTILDAPSESQEDSTFSPSPREMTAEDGIQRFSNSELTTFKTCRRRWWLAYERNLKPRSSSVFGAANTGLRVHRALQHYYVPDGQPKMNILDAHAYVIDEDWNKIIDASGLEGVSPDIEIAFNKAVDLEKAMLEGYVEWLADTGADSELTVTGPEEYVEADLPGTNVRIIGRLDVRVRRSSDGFRGFMDHKPQPLTSLILTPSGWTKMGDLKVGDVICDYTGAPTRVTAVYDRGVDDVYEIVLNDGSSVQSTKDHPWMARTSTYRSWKITDVQSLRPKHRLMSFTPSITLMPVQLPVDPYVLGAWIANGSKNGHICDGVEETMIATGFPVVISQRENRKPLFTAKVPIEVRHALDGLNLLDKNSQDRFIPKQYMFAASYDQKLMLLRGLMDGDGAITVNNSSIYVTSSISLAHDVVDLVRSLGGWAKIYHQDKFNYVGSKIDGYHTVNKIWVVYIRSSFNPFLHITHAQRWLTHKESVKHHKGVPSTDKIIRSIKYIGREPVRCIEIDAPSHLYVTDGYTVSHNTVGNFSEPVKLLPLNEQMLMYILLESLQSETPVFGAIYNMLRKVKRTATAKPPFYERVEVHHNKWELESFSSRLVGTIIDLQNAQTEVQDNPQNHHSIVYPTPTRDCHWKCEFFQICPMFDDGSRVEDAITSLYQEHDPYSYYSQPVVVEQSSIE